MPKKRVLMAMSGGVDSSVFSSVIKTTGIQSDWSYHAGMGLL